MKLENLTEQEKVQITKEQIDKVPLETVGLVALLKLSKMSVDTNAATVEIKTEATIDGQRYNCKMVVSCKKINQTK